MSKKDNEQMTWLDGLALGLLMISPTIAILIAMFIVKLLTGGGWNW